MPMAKIITVPNPILRKISQPVDISSKKSRRIIKEMETFLSAEKNPKGVGLSAIQIGKPLNVFCLYLPKSGNPQEKESYRLTSFINPQIIKVSKNKTLGPDKNKPLLEGCLSIPDIWGPVWRHHWITIKWQDKTGTLNQTTFSAFEARIIQHEYDHLRGILFTDYSLRDRLPLYEAEGEKLRQLSL